MSKTYLLAWIAHIIFCIVPTDLVAANQGPQKPQKPNRPQKSESIFSQTVEDMVKTIDDRTSSAQDLKEKISQVNVVLRRESFHGLKSTVYCKLHG